MDLNALASTRMPSPTHTWACYDLDLWPAESNEDIRGVNEYSLSIISKLFKPFMRYRGNNIRQDERTNGRDSGTVWKHNAFADTVGWWKDKNCCCFVSCRKKVNFSEALAVHCRSDVAVRHQASPAQLAGVRHEPTHCDAMATSVRQASVIVMVGCIVAQR